jgi:hypothetical protein
MGSYTFHGNLYVLAFLRGDAPAMVEQQKWFTGKPEENIGLSLSSDTEAYIGHLRKAQELSKQSVDSAIHADSKETAAISRRSDREEVAAPLSNLGCFRCLASISLLCLQV